MWFLLFSTIVTICGVVVQLLQVYKIVLTLRSYYQMTTRTRFRFYQLVLALYSVFQMLKIFQMKKKVTNFRTNRKFLNVKRKMTLTMTTQECDPPQPSARRRKVEEMLQEKKGKKLTTKFSQETQAL